MSKNILRGDSVARSKIYRVVLSNFSAGTKLTATIGNKRITYESQSSEDAADGMATLINASAHSEFRELLAEASGNVLTISARTPGMDVFIDFSTSGSVSGAIVVTRTTAGHEQVNEVQKLKLSDGTTGGTFTYANDFGSGAETTGNINWGASNDDVKAAIVALATPTAADLDVVKISDIEWHLYWKGAFAAVEVPEGTIDATNLTGNGDVTVETVTPGHGLSDEVQIIQVRDGTLGAGSYSYKLRFGGQTTTTLTETSDAAAVQTALAALSSIGSGNVAVYGGRCRSSSGAGNHNLFAIHFKGDLAGINVAMLESIDELSCINLIWIVQAGGEATRDEVQIVNLGNPSGGTFTLTYGSETTGDLSYQAIKDQVESQLEALTAFDNVEVNSALSSSQMFATGIYIIRFRGTSADTNLDALTLNAGSLTAPTSPSVTTIIDGGGNQNEVQHVRVFASGGTFVLSDGTDTTSAIAFGALAATIKTRLETDIAAITTVTVTGTGTPADPYVVTYTDPGNTDVPELIGDGALLTGGAGTVTETVAHHAGANEVQTITLSPSVTGGLWDGELTDIPFGPYGIAEPAAVIEDEFESILGVGNITVAGSAGGPYAVTYQGAYANTPMPLLTVDGTDLIVAAGSELVSIEVTQKSSGPNHANDGDNFSLLRAPETGDDLYFEDGNTDLLYGLDWIRNFTVDAANERLTIVDHDFADGQKVRVRTTTTLPAGLAVDTDYYVIDLGKDAIQLSATRGGSPIDITDAGTGTHTLAVELNAIHVGGRWIGGFGLPKRNNTGRTEYVEHRNRKLRVGLLATGDKKVVVGQGEGNASGRMVLDTGTYEVDAIIFRTGSPRDEGTPAFQHVGQNANSLVTVYDGESGFAFFAGEVGEYRKIIHAEGLVNFGEGHVTAEYLKTGGEVLSAGAVFNGPVTILG